MAAVADELGEFLAANGLGAFAHTFAAEQITLQDVALLNDDHLVKLGIPMGPRVRILNLSGTAPTRPDRPPGSHGSPRHMALLQASTDDQTNPLMNSGKKYSCFLSHHKAACAMEGET